ncbi:DUF6264 family protein [Microbacterium sp. C7(2022)]|uniref:DUF6264 family protein n=1 Tax=Microbacterium sp. C7(2022) TaxID=2992759 RepID=UPI00237B3E3E|nr:DUF6264 family protein [Microbacterium sp. C7(2022)]MDE0545760.1 DUF6264 family protein [Microbacterium sp. C7(2022)]
MTDSSDPRPRPQYGEYATPEEQRARIRQPDVAAALDVGMPAHEVAEPPAETDAAPGAGAAHAVPTPKRRPVDRIVTFGLLAYGLITVVTSFNTLVDYNAYAAQVLEMMGADPGLATGIDGRSWGVAAALVLAGGWLLTAALSWLSLARARITWWIPVVGAIVFTTVSAVLMLTPLMNDPAVWDALLAGVAG